MEKLGDVERGLARTLLAEFGAAAAWTLLQQPVVGKPLMHTLEATAR